MTILPTLFLLVAPLGARTWHLPVIRGENRSVLRPERVERGKKAREEYRLYLQGRRTEVRFPPDAITDSRATIQAARTPKGIVYGSVFQIQSGATIVSGTILFIGDHGRAHLPQGDQIHARGERLVITSGGNNEGTFWSPAASVLYERGRFRSIGPAAKVHVESSGRVTGWYLATADDRAYEGDLEGAPPLYRRYFVWKDGTRFLKGRRLDR